VIYVRDGDRNNVNLPGKIELHAGTLLNIIYQYNIETEVTEAVWYIFQRAKNTRQNWCHFIAEQEGQKKASNNVYSIPNRISTLLNCTRYGTANSNKRCIIILVGWKSNDTCENSKTIVKKDHKNHMGNTKENMHLDIGAKGLIKVFVPHKTPSESFVQLSKLNTGPEYNNSTHQSIPKFPVFSELSSSDSLDFLFLCFSFSAFCLKYLKKKTHTHTINCFYLSGF